MTQTGLPYKLWQFRQYSARSFAFSTPALALVRFARDLAYQCRQMKSTRGGRGSAECGLIFLRTSWTTNG